jgi:hypothetical protein
LTGTKIFAKIFLSLSAHYSQGGAMRQRSPCRFKIDPDKLLAVIEEVESQIRQNNISQQDMADLYQRLGSLYELMGDRDQQLVAWSQAKKLASGTQSLEEVF